MRQIGDQVQVVNADEAWIYIHVETSVNQKDTIIICAPETRPS
jgi:hypothetical protein